MLRKSFTRKPPRNMAPANLAEYAYSSIRSVMASTYFLAMATPIYLVLVFNLERKTNVATIADFMASMNTTNRWPNGLDCNSARQKIILRATKQNTKHRIFIFCFAQKSGAYLPMSSI